MEFSEMRIKQMLDQITIRFYFKWNCLFFVIFHQKKTSIYLRDFITKITTNDNFFFGQQILSRMIVKIRSNTKVALGQLHSKNLKSLSNVRHFVIYQNGIHSMLNNFRKFSRQICLTHFSKTFLIKIHRKNTNIFLVSILFLSLHQLFVQV